MFQPQPGCSSSSVAGSSGSSSTAPGSSVTTSSTLTETVSIDYEDFSDSFLKCATCMCVYEALEHNPKLLPCSHTVCHACLEHIVEAQGADCTSFRCPICREVVPVPRGGVPAFPPSFIINQLLDLMARQRRDVVPMCARHAQTELLFCETCDCVFCTDCTSAGSGAACAPHSVKGASAHTVIPFSVAIKRMSEIVLYKTGLCIKNLDRASEGVGREMQRLDLAAETCLDTATLAFQEIAALVESRREEMAQTVRRIRDDKMRRLQEQLDIIEGEKAKVRSTCQGLDQQVEVRNISAKIGDLNEKLDMSTTLLEPRENAFMLFEQCASRVQGEGGPGLDGELSGQAGRLGSGSGDSVTASAAGNLQGGSNRDAVALRQNSPGHGACATGKGAIAWALAQFGCVRVSKTFPALCTVTLEPITVHLSATIHIQAVDYHGNPQMSGGDPFCAEVTNERRDKISTRVVDNADGTYTVKFVTATACRHVLDITVFERRVRDGPFQFGVSAHINPTQRIGRTGSGESEFRQPVAMALVGESLCVLDTGNSRIQVFDSRGRHQRGVMGKGLENHSATGMALTPGGNLVVVNWRTKRVTEICTSSWETVRGFGCDEFVEPICVTVSRSGVVVVGDNGLGKLLIFDPTGKKLGSIGSPGTKPGQFKLISCVYSTPSGSELLVCDHRVQAFSRAGSLLYEFPQRAGARGGAYGGVTVDAHGNYLMTRSEKGRSVVEVYDSTRAFLYDIDSSGDALKRPCGLVTTGDGCVFVVDLGNDCVKKYRYM